MSEDLDPNKYHVINKSNKVLIWSAVLFVLLIVLPILSYTYYVLAVNRPSQTDREVTFEIGKGMSMPEIASSLYTQGAINSEFLFNLYLYLNKVDRKIQAGVYVIPAGTSIVELSEMLQLGKNDTQIRFLEGWRLEEYAREAAGTYENIDYKKFVDLARPYEGYLFPDTYIFNKEINEEEMVQYLRDTFDKKTEDILTEEKLSLAGLTRDQAVILASIVEREAFDDEERPIIAGILLKRYREGMRIDADATVQYAVALTRLCPLSEFQDEPSVICAPALEDLLELDWWPSDLYIEDLEYPSSYNTRLYVDLPPAPISSVGRASLLAVLESKETPYYYYLHDPEGVVHYAITVEEHNSNIELYLR